jgi:hypothetical protein
MFLPFCVFSEDLMQRLVRYGHSYFVRQTVVSSKRVFSGGVKGRFLMTHYKNLKEAEQHFEAIAFDPNRYLYHYNVLEHRTRLHVAAAGVSGYQIYSSLLRENWERDLSDSLQKKVKRYVSKLGWKPGKADPVGSELELEYGRIFLRLTFKDQQARVTFEEIENLL